MKKGKAPNDTKLLFQARRYFARALCIKNPGAVANVGYAELIEATQGQRREDERGRWITSAGVSGGNRIAELLEELTPATGA